MSGGEKRSKFGVAPKAVSSVPRVSSTLSNLNWLKSTNRTRLQSLQQGLESNYIEAVGETEA